LILKQSHLQLGTKQYIISKSPIHHQFLSPWVITLPFSIISINSCIVNVPKTRRTYCKGKSCRKHTVHKVTQYKTGKASVFAQVSILSIQFRMYLNGRENDDMTGNKAVTVVKPNQCSTRRYQLVLTIAKSCLGENHKEGRIAFGV
jgi:ribosomal protein L44E